MAEDRDDGLEPTVTLTAYFEGSRPEVSITPAERSRSWMENTPKAFALSCAPLMLANQGGWVLRSPVDVTITWNGGSRPEDIDLRIGGRPRDGGIVTAQGGGIVAWRVPYWFATTAGWSLLVRQPSNTLKDGIGGLEMLYQTGRRPEQIQVCWQMLGAGREVRFRRGEGFGMLVPIRNGEIQAFTCVVGALSDEPGMEDWYRTWEQHRMERFRASRPNPAPGTPEAAAAKRPREPRLRLMPFGSRQWQ